MALTKKTAFPITKEAALLKEAITLEQAKDLLRRFGVAVCVKGFSTKQTVKIEVKTVAEAEQFFHE